MKEHAFDAHTGLAAGPRLDLGRGHIDLWLTYYDRIDDEGLLWAMRRLLSAAEREQEGRFHFADDRRRYLVTRAMVRTVLSRYAPVAPADWRFCANAHGRPAIAAVHAQAAGLCFNLSHTRGLIALGVTRQRALGVDVESLCARAASLGVAQRFFSRSEAAELAALPAERRQDRFFEYWTFKEAYTKARGMGLSIPLDQFSFSYPHERAVRLSVEPGLGDDAARWSFWQMRPAGGYLLAVCAERLDESAPALSVRRFVPLQGEEEVELAVSKRSEALLEAGAA